MAGQGAFHAFCQFNVVVFGHTAIEMASHLQERGILPVVRGHDTIIQAQAGTGKTATFAIGALECIDNEKPKTQCIVLAPTRELATQSCRVIGAIGDYLDVSTHAFIGGTKVRDDKEILRRGCQVMSGTPGRVLDLMRQRSLDTRHVKLFILDEADELLNQGFCEDIYQIFRLLNEDVQVVLVSATIPEEVLEMTLTLTLKAKS